MGLFDFIFGNKKKEDQERLERERQAELQPIYAALSDIQCKQPPTFPMPYVPASGSYIPVSYSVPMHFGTNYNNCGYNYGC
mgnify:CR=1 FL=1